MRKIILGAFIFSLMACSSHAPEPKSWKHDLDGVKEEQVNTDIEHISQQIGHKK